MARIVVVAAGAGLLLAAAAPAARAAEPAMVQCGREYQAAKAAGTLNGADWNAYRTTCAARLKASAAAVPTASPAATTLPAPSTTPAPGAAPLPGAAAAPAAGPPAASGGMAAMHARQKQCGAEWRAEKAALLARTPGLTWPKYWSQCNARLKAANG